LAGFGCCEGKRERGGKLDKDVYALLGVGELQIALAWNKHVMVLRSLTAATTEHNKGPASATQQISMVTRGGVDSYDKAVQGC
jgi:hypothetical protein